MFMARQKPQARKAPNRRTMRLRTLERRYDFHLGEEIRAALQGHHDKAATHSATALSISRELCAAARDPRWHRGSLAAALCNHARYAPSTTLSIALLTESAGHYTALAKADPAGYEVQRIDVLTRVALAADVSGNTRAAIGLLREVVVMYRTASAANPAERDLGLARARFHLGRCLLKSGSEAEALAEIDTGLALAWQALDRLRLPACGPDWLATTPRFVQLAAPDWAAAAVRSMTLHAAAGRWENAAGAAHAAARLSGGLASLGGDALRRAHEAIQVHADAIREHADCPQRAVAR